jgi:hypothetical protein
MRKFLHGVLALATIVGVFSLMTRDQAQGSTVNQSQSQFNDTGPPTLDEPVVFVVSLSPDGVIFVSRELPCDKLADPAWQHQVVAIYATLTDLGPIAIVMDYKDGGEINQASIELTLIDTAAADPACTPDFRPKATTVLAGSYHYIDEGLIVRTPTTVASPVLTLRRTATSPRPAWITVNAGSRTKALG